MRKHKGFSLIELLITIAIILIVAAIAIPNILRSKMAANEASAVNSVRAINVAQMTYASTYVNTGYTDLASLGPRATNPCVASTNTACLLDATVSWNNGNPPQKSGFTFTSLPVGVAPVTQFTANANPIVWNSSGTRAFYSDETVVIRFNSTAAPAGPADKPLN
jgi:type IV pilus assembly protein PilA